MPQAVAMAEDNDPASASGQARRKANLRLALILASVALVFLLGFVGKMVLLGR